MKNMILIGLLVLATAISSQAASVKAVVRVVDGDATVTLPGSSQAIPLKEGVTLPSGSVITTGPGSTVMLTPFPGSSALIKENSEVSVDSVTYSTSGSTVENRAADLGLHSGTMAFAVDPGLEDVTDFSIHAGGAVAAARGASGLCKVNHKGDMFSLLAVTGATMKVKLPYGQPSIVLHPGEIFVKRADRERLKLEHEVKILQATHTKESQRKIVELEHQWDVYVAQTDAEIYLQEAIQAIRILVNHGVAKNVAIQELTTALQKVGINLNTGEITNEQKLENKIENNPQLTVPVSQRTIDETKGK